MKNYKYKIKVTVTYRNDKTMHVNHGCICKPTKNVLLIHQNDKIVTKSKMPLNTTGFIKQENQRHKYNLAMIQERQDHLTRKQRRVQPMPAMSVSEASVNYRRTSNPGSGETP